MACEDITATWREASSGAYRNRYGAQQVPPIKDDPSFEWGANAAVGHLIESRMSAPMAGLSRDQQFIQEAITATVDSQGEEAEQIVEALIARKRRELKSAVFDSITPHVRAINAGLPVFV